MGHVADKHNVTVFEWLADPGGNKPLLTDWLAQRPERAASRLVSKPDGLGQPDEVIAVSGGYHGTWSLVLLRIREENKTSCIANYRLANGIPFFLSCI